MKKTRVFARGAEFPHEGFVQESLEAYFLNQGFQIWENGYADMFCSHPVTGETWHIEAKGVTSAVGLDFRTGLGQLIQGMRSEKTKYGIAIPDTEAFRRQVAAISPWVVSRLGIHWLYVAPDGAVNIVAPPSNSGLAAE